MHRDSTLPMFPICSGQPQATLRPRHRSPLPHVDLPEPLAVHLLRLRLEGQRPDPADADGGQRHWCPHPG